MFLLCTCLTLSYLLTLPAHAVGGDRLNQIVHQFIKCVSVNNLRESDCYRAKPGEIALHFSRHVNSLLSLLHQWGPFGPLTQLSEMQHVSTGTGFREMCQDVGELLGEGCSRTCSFNHNCWK